MSSRSSPGLANPRPARGALPAPLLPIPPANPPTRRGDPCRGKKWQPSLVDSRARNFIGEPALLQKGPGPGWAVGDSLSAWPPAGGPRGLGKVGRRRWRERRDASLELPPAQPLIADAGY